MSENKRFDENIEFDELNIRSHLNDSLDLSGISVSEDLINRTLMAIKLSESQDIVAKGNESLTENDTTNQTAEHNWDEKDNARNETAGNKKVIPWNRYIRAFAGVAAAVVVVALGYGFASNGVFSGYKATKSDEQAYDMARKEAAENNEADVSERSTVFQEEESSMNALAANESTSSDSTATSEDSQDPKLSDDVGIFGGATEEGTGATTTIESPKYSIMADVPVTANKDDAKIEDGSTASSSGSVGSTDKDKSAIQSTDPSFKMGLSSQETVLSFRDIFLADPAEASSLTITDEINDITLVLTTKEEIQSFYQVMEQHQYTVGDQATNNTNFSLQIASPTPSRIRYTMYVGDSIIVDYSDELMSRRSMYTTSTLPELSAAIQEFCKKHQ